MKDLDEYPKIVLPPDFDDQKEYEIPFRGYLGPITVITKDRMEYSVFFVDPIRLQQELSGELFFAEVGLIVLHEVTLDAIRVAVRKLDDESFFSQLKPEKPTLSE